MVAPEVLTVVVVDHTVHYSRLNILQFYFLCFLSLQLN